MISMGFRGMVALLTLFVLPFAFAGEDDEACLDCHADIEDMLLLTVHNGNHQVGCTNCHGTSEEHLDDPTPENILSGTGIDGAQACLTCHVNDSHAQSPWVDLHRRADVTCSDCHRGHEERPKQALLKDGQTELCLSCHQSVKAILDKPFTHPVGGHGSMSCSDCHNPHGGAGSARFAEGPRMADTCNSCHPAQEGPFVFPHVSGSEGDCLTCHEVHGSNNPKQLTRARVYQLCLECHSTQPSGTLGSQPPSTHNLRLPRYQNCLSCHTAVHGSSSHPALVK